MKEKIANSFSSDAMRKFLIRTLGREMFAQCQKFFSQVINDDSDYKVVVSPRCFALAKLFSLLEGNDHSVADFGLMFDDAFLLCADRLALSYRNALLFPDIAIIDDVLNHGRAVNRVLEQMVSRVHKILTDQNVAVSKDKLEREIGYATRIYTVCMSRERLLLYPSFQRRMIVNKRVDHADLHQFAADTASAARDVSVCSPHSLSLPIRGFNDEEQNALQSFLRSKADRDLVSFPYQNVCFQMGWVYPVTANNGDVPAVFSLRLVPCEIDHSMILTASLLVTDLQGTPAELESLLFRLLFSAEMLAHTENWKISGHLDKVSIYARLLLLLLTKNFLLLAIDGCGIDGIADRIDMDDISAEFPGQDQSGVRELLDQIVNRDTPWLSYVGMNNLLLHYCGGSEPLFRLEEKEMKRGSQDNTLSVETVQAVNDTLADMLTGYSLDSEKQARNQFVRNRYAAINQSSGRKISEVFADLDTVLRRKGLRIPHNEQYVACAVSLLLRLNDMGAGMVSCVCDQSLDAFNVSCIFRTQKMAFMLYIARYTGYLQVLSDLENCCLMNEERVLIRIARWLQETGRAERTKEIQDLYQTLNKIGYRCKDWEINLGGWTEAGWEEVGEIGSIFSPERRDREVERAAELFHEDFRLFDNYLKCKEKW